MMISDKALCSSLRGESGASQTDARMLLCAPRSALSSAFRLSLAWWPSHVPPTEQVQVQMKYGLSCVGIRVDNESITALRDSFALRKVGGHPREVAQYCRIRHVAE